MGEGEDDPNCEKGNKRHLGTGELRQKPKVIFCKQRPGWVEKSIAYKKVKVKNCSLKHSGRSGIPWGEGGMGNVPDPVNNFFMISE